MQQVFEFLLAKANYQKDAVVADPWKVIPIGNVKHAKQVTEVHLGNINAESLTNFNDFPNLETVWLNSNKLKDLQGLQKNYRIKHLNVQNNRISNIQNSIPLLNNLQSLLIYNNDLRDLQKIISILKNLKSLKHLQLFGNPLSSEPNYKTRVIAAFPHLQIFDRHKITFQQRQAAIKFMGPRK